MKTKTMAGLGTQGMFVLFVAIAILAAYALPAFAHEAVVTDVGKKANLQVQDTEQMVVFDPALLSMRAPDAGADEAVEPAAPDAGADEVVAPDEPEEASVPDAGSDAAAAPSADTSRVPQAEETTPSDEPEDDDTPTLPYTGGNGTPYVIGGLLIALAGVALFIGRRHVYNR
jgi:LPXTG-motif cell wall-anchored protein